MLRTRALAKYNRRWMSGDITSKAVVQARLSQLLEKGKAGWRQPTRPFSQDLVKFSLPVKKNTEVHLGYPYNLKQSYADLLPFMDFFLNNRESTNGIVFEIREFEPRKIVSSF
jgi:hypothetical protein